MRSMIEIEIEIDLTDLSMNMVIKSRTIRSNILNRQSWTANYGLTLPAG